MQAHKTAVNGNIITLTVRSQEDAVLLQTPSELHLFEDTAASGMRTLVCDLIGRDGPIHPVHRTSFHRHGRHGAGGAEILASSASYALHRIDHRNVFHKRNRLYRTMAFTRRAYNPLLGGDAAILVPHRASDMRMDLLIAGYPEYRIGRTHLRATRTGRTAISMFKPHLGQKETLRIAGRTQNLLRADLHAQLTAHAFRAECGQALRARRNNRRGALRDPGD